MKLNLFTLIGIICLFSQAKAQNKFDYLNSFTTQYDYVHMSNVKTISKNELVFSAVVHTSNQYESFFLTNSTILFRTTLNGDFINYKNIDTIKGINIWNINNVFEEANDSLIIIANGINFIDSSMNLVYAHCDRNFNISNVKVIPVMVLVNKHPGTFSNGMICKKHPKGGYYGSMEIIGHIFDSFSNRWGYADSFYRFSFRIDDEGNLLNIGKIPNLVSSSTHLIQGYTNIEYSKSINQYKIIDVSNENYLLDSNMSLIASHLSDLQFGYEELLSGANSIMPYKNKHIVAGAYYRYYSSSPLLRNGYINLKVLNDSFAVIHSQNIYTDSIGSSNNTTATPEINSVDFVNEDSIFFAFYSIEYDDRPSDKITIFMTDSNFNIRWKDTLKVTFPPPHSNSISLQSVKATVDGGCIVVGYLAPFNHTMFIMKYDKSGMHTSLRFLEKDFTEITVYPNPSSDKIFIGGETQGRDFILYDMQGKTVSFSSNRELTNGIDISSLTNGMYFYKITDKNTGAIKSGKWLKQ
jgi:hypothetical protein